MVSWDIVVARLAGSSIPSGDANQARPQVPLGTLEEVQARIKAQLPELDARFGNRLWHYRGMGFGIEFAFGSEDPIRQLLLHVAGGGDPIAVLVRIAKPNGWTLIDCSDGAMLDLDRPSYEGWAAWQLFAYQHNPCVVAVRWAGETRVLHLRYAPVPEHAPQFAAGIVESAQRVMGVALDYTPGNLAAVDAILDRLSADGETFRSVAETVFGFGCYVGEVVKRFGGTWLNAHEGPAGVTDFPLALRVGDRFVDPIGQTARRLERGGESSLVAWVRQFFPHNIETSPGAVGRGDSERAGA